MPVFAAGLVAASFASSCLLTGAMIRLLRRQGRLDIPNARSSHSEPTPRGAGAAVMGTLVCAWLLVLAVEGWGNGGEGPVLALALTALAAVSWIDDRRPLPWRLRLAVHTAAVLAMAAIMSAGTALPLPSSQGVMLAGLPVLVLAWLWVINLTNFMDGIDGIVGVEMAAASFGTALCLLALGAAPALILLALALCAAMLGFLIWNWPPAKIFLGDVGSIPLGFLLGFFMLALAAHGAWGAALSLPSVFLADATLTLLIRWQRGERLTEAHRSHFYQRAAGLDRAGHRAVVLRVAAANALLVISALLSLKVGGIVGQLLTCAAAAVIVTMLLWSLTRLAGRRAK